ncbi:hypothetical protein llap_9538 [Limosa lapponica baueri]|uniref:Uncharacterized protein n=1 Tax=Limosa lapponica baueri TaxID=1758121 RepID=A0A2I0U251_LIMLA|nr:hypothetical protein llap_9538 [Limosa lapponica baueri]
MASSMAASGRQLVPPPRGICAWCHTPHSLVSYILPWKRDSPEEEPGASAKEEECKDHSDKELSQGEDNNIRNIWVNSSVPELFQDPSVGPQERPSWPSSLDTEEAGDIAGNLQRESPVLARHRSPLPSATEEGACRVFGEQDPEAESQEAPPYTPPDYEDKALQDAALSIVREAVINALLVTQHKLAQRMGAATTATAPAGPQDTKSPLTGEAQGDASTAPLLLAVAEHEENMSSSASENDHKASDEGLQETSLYIMTEVMGKAVLVNKQHQAQRMEITTAPPPAEPQDTESPLAEEASTAPLTPTSENEGDAATSPMAQDLPHQVTSECREEAQPSCGHRDMPEDVPGITALPHTPAQKRQPSLFRQPLRALRRAFHCSCIMGQKEQ